MVFYRSIFIIVQNRINLW